MKFYFRGLFFGFPNDTSTSPVKKSHYSRKSCEQRMFTAAGHAKQGAIDIKNTPGYIQYANAKKKVFFVKMSQTWPHFFLRIYFLYVFSSCDLISLDYVGSPRMLWIQYPRNLKLKTLFPDFFTNVFISRLFSRNFFPMNFLFFGTSFQ